MTPEELEKLRREDHDSITKLTTKFDDFLKQYQVDMAQLKDGYTSKLTDHETRLRVIEKTIDQVNLNNLNKDVLDTKNAMQNFKATAMAWRTVGGLVGGFVMFILTQLPNILKLLGIVK